MAVYKAISPFDKSVWVKVATTSIPLPNNEKSLALVS